ncbi:Transcriptional regulatory protein sin3 [Physocladia obscura]|uniref:Transcriptional regulatory protein sin3 n=1 Tax=Physocladia obscura TaxID=109957 RepID=A0AAD5TCL6_9FUNG|nr:Transcriptional regulatory protein sin3 [Physocladia obscura]
MSEAPAAQSTEGNGNLANGLSTITKNQRTLNNTTSETPQLQSQPQNQIQQPIQALSQLPQQYPQQQPPQQPQKQQPPPHTGYPTAQSSTAPQLQPHQQNHNPYQPRSINVKDALSYLDQVMLQFQAYRIEATMNPLDPSKVYTPTGLQTSSIRQQSPPVPAPAAIQQQPQHYINQQLPQSYYSHPQHHPQNLPPQQQQSHIPEPPPGYHIPSQHHQQSQQRHPHPYSLMAPNHDLHNQTVPQQVSQPVQAVQQPPVLHQQASLTQQIPPMSSHLEVAQKKTPVEFGHANRFSNEPDTYKHFLEILQTYQKESKPIQQVYAQVQVLFRSAPDLLNEFKHFLPEVGSIVNKGGNSLASAARGATVMPQIATWSDNRRPSASNILYPTLH